MQKKWWFGKADPFFEYDIFCLWSLVAQFSGVFLSFTEEWNPSLRNRNSKRSQWLRGSQVCLQQQQKSIKLDQKNPAFDGPQLFFNIYPCWFGSCPWTFSTGTLKLGDERSVSFSFWGHVNFLGDVSNHEHFVGWPTVPGWTELWTIKSMIVLAVFLKKTSIIFSQWFFDGLHMVFYSWEIILKRDFQE